MNGHADMKSFVFLLSSNYIFKITHTCKNLIFFKKHDFVLHQDSLLLLINTYKILSSFDIVFEGISWAGNGHYSSFGFFLGVDVANGPGGERQGHCGGGVGVGAG